jgi:hypothetical protein
VLFICLNLLARLQSSLGPAPIAFAVDHCDAEWRLMHLLRGTVSQTDRASTHTDTFQPDRDVHSHQAQGRWVFLRRGCLACLLACTLRRSAANAGATIDAQLTRTRTDTIT